MFMKKIFFAVLLLLLLSTDVFAYTYDKFLNQAVEYLLKEDYDFAVQECNKFIDTANPHVKAEALHLKGTCLLESGQYAQAREIFKEARPFAKGDLRTEIFLGIADTYFMQKRYADAISIYEQLLNKDIKKNDYLAVIYYKIGKSYQRDSKWTKSDQYFRQLEEQFPQSLEAELVKNSSVEGNYFTVQVGCFANKQNADKLYDDLKDKGYEAFLSSFESLGQKFYRVRVGKFVSYVAAEYTENELRNKESLPTHIFP